MLMPKRVKRRKQFRGTMAGKALRGNKITNGEYGIVALEPAWIKSNQIEAARIAMTRYVKRNGKVWIKIFPDKPVTAKPAETRMGSGKGALEYWVAVVKPGRVMFEIAGVPEETAREVCTFENENYRERDLKIDKILTSKTFGIPIMILFLGIIFWITIVGANYPSEFLFNVFNWFQDKLVYFANYIHSPAWLSDMLINGVYKTLTWIIAVMLPPMAIFFPLFTILEDLGYLPRIAFNMDGFFKKACCSGKQMITMCMGVTKWYFFYLSNIYVTQILYLPEFIRHIYIN